MKKFLTSFALCFVVIGLAVCGLAGCGKKQQEPAEPIVETITLAEMEEYFEENDSYLAFVDGFAVKMKIESANGQTFSYIDGTVILYNAYTDVRASVSLLSQTNIKISGDAYLKEGDVYADINFSPKLWVEYGYDIDGYILKCQETVSEFVDYVRELPEINYYPEEIIADLAERPEVVVEKTTNLQTGEVVFALYAGENGASFAKFSFNKFNELSTFEAVIAAADGDTDNVSLTLEMLEVDHNTRIPYPEGYENYTDVSARE